MNQQLASLIRAAKKTVMCVPSDPELSLDRPENALACAVAVELEKALLDRDRLTAHVAALREACEAALLALERAAAELGGTGYFASKADEVRAALAATADAR